MSKIIDKKQIMTAIIDDFNRISVFFTTPITLPDAHLITLYCEGSVADYMVDYVSENKASLITQPLNVKKLYTVAVDDKTVEAIPHYVLDKEAFTYRGDDLGLTYSKKCSTFKVWAPTATQIMLNVYDTLDGEGKQRFALTEQGKGVWTVTVNGDLLGKYYSFNADGALSAFDKNRELVDPYSRCAIGLTRRSLITDLNAYDDIAQAQTDFPLRDAIIYEVHVRDVSIDHSSGLNAGNGLYLGMTQTDTSFNNTPTVTAHFKDLGVNTIQIMPIQDFDNDESDKDFYGWGYMPRHFNSPDGAYSSNWKDDSKMRETLQMVDTLHKEGFKVTLDVVYNHTAEGFWGEGIESFNGFVPYYYYRIAGNGYVSNGSGCGNEFRTESVMGRKFIIDSLKFWTTFYKFDGYRFDLMGLIDIDTCKAIVYNLKQINRNIFIYGEPWTGGLTPIQPTYKGAQRGAGFSVFNDDLRDALKGAVFNKMEKGYVQTKGQYSYDRVIQGIMGSINTFAAFPSESINYVEVHDNNTLFDKLYFTQTGRQEYSEPSEQEISEIKTLHKLTGFILLTSQGVPILHLGQDFMRTKQGVENSYNSGDIINQIDWTRKARFFDVFTYYQALIDIRKKHPLFRLISDDDVRKNLVFNNDFPTDFMHCIKYTLSNGHEFGDSASKILVVINPYPKEYVLHLGECYTPVLIGSQYYRDESQPGIWDVTLAPLSGNILLQK